MPPVFAGNFLEDTLANHKSAIKRHKQSLKRAARNRAARTRIKNVVKAVRLAVQSQDREGAATALVAANSVLDKYAGNAVHWKNASRKMSRLARAVNAMEA
jgi:ribosomal protein S20